MERLNHTDSDQRASRSGCLRIGCALPALALLYCFIVGPLDRKAYEHSAIERMFMPMDTAMAHHVDKVLKDAGIADAKATDLIRDNPDCCAIEPVTYNPINWAAHHFLFGWMGSPAYLGEVKFHFVRESRTYAFRSFGRITNGGGFIGEGPGGFQIAGPPNEPSDTPGVTHAGPAYLLPRTQTSELVELRTKLQEECRQREGKNCSAIIVKDWRPRQLLRRPASAKARRPATAVNMISGCALPKPGAMARAIMITADDRQISTATVAGQDEVTTSSTIKIKPGLEPLYIFATGGAPHIWKFEGAVERIEHLVISSSDTDEFSIPKVGQIGVSPERTTIASDQCLLTRPENDQSQPYPDKGRWLEDRLGKEIEKPTYGTVTVFGDGTSTATGPDMPEPIEVVRNKQEAVIKIDARKVVSARAVGYYQTLPRAAGLAQLVSKGDLTRISARIYIINGKAKLPPGLHGGHSVTFIPPLFGPAPTGDPGHSCIANIWQRVSAYLGVEC